MQQGQQQQSGGWEQKLEQTAMRDVEQKFGGGQGNMGRIITLLFYYKFLFFQF
jgi:hypothetical protein